MSNYKEERSEQIAWCFTVKYNKHDHEVTLETYQVVLDLFTKYGFVKYVESETDSKGVLHLHGILMLRKGFFRRRLVLPNYHLHLMECTSEDQWLKYITKQSPVATPKIPYLFDKVYEPFICPDTIPHNMLDKQ